MHTGSPPREVKTVSAKEKAIVDSALAGVVNRGARDIEWVDIPGGTFRMGSEQAEEAEKPVHEVTLGPYSIARYPFTNAQYAVFVAATGARPPTHWEDGRIPEGRDMHPVVSVSWDEAKKFCDWLSGQMAEEGQRIDLPTEAQWEYAARGTNGREYPWGAELPDAERCNFGRTVGDTTPVDAYPKGTTPEGVADLAGNVWEWILDSWHPNYQGAPSDGSAWEPGGTGASRVVRGGSWYSLARGCRSAYRNGNPPVLRFGSLGFRCARAQA